MNEKLFGSRLRQFAGRSALQATTNPDPVERGQSMETTTRPNTPKIKSRIRATITIVP